ncbi:protein disulfide-isomerase A5 [Exaiptasia diaphana]|uniref:Thioredoxin domain-containing protein n=1 Tax=Exaiptasia diaphana TaxID=2652724 RepID=A0A913YAP3_EXADI|nr:protein disulfide-isomerase A5 [Exaiptasia diaphana]
MQQLGIQLIRILAIFVMTNVVPFQAKKSNNRRFVLDVNDIKPFKKLQRTHTNLLVLFSKNDKSASSYFELLGNIAKEIKGKGTVAYINCGESKKLCKKLKVTPKPSVIKHFKDGEFNKDYDRKYTFKSMMKFMSDPTGDAPWEEEPGAEDVAHIETAQQLSKLFSNEKKPVLIMFYAPWCGFCKRFKPEYASAATEIKDEVVLAGMDVDTQEGYSIRMKYNITGFPTVIYFVNGEEKYKYSGKYEKDALVEWLKNPSAPPPKEEEEEQWSDVPSEVAHLTDSTFDDFMAKNPSVLVMFYAPWCGHCKQMKPEYTEAAKTLKDQGISGILAAVDATKERNLGKKFKVEGYPTVKYFRDGKVAFDVNERKADAIISFMKDPKEPPPPPPPDPEWSDVAPNVLHLTDETFKTIIKKKKHVLVMFYAPWCGHCKKAKPEIVIAAEHHKSNSKAAFAGVDCTKYPGVCQQYDVHGYPTFRYFNYGKKDFKYTGGRTSKDFIQFMEDPKEGPPTPPPEPEWSDEPSSVYHLTDDDFEDVIKSHESVLVMFYAPWCGHCKAMKPNYAKAADEIGIKKVNGILAAVDCTKHRKTAKKFEVNGYPTLKHFRNGKLGSEYNHGRTTEDLVDFMSRIGEEKAAKAETVKTETKKKEPKEGSWSAENKDVVHLDDTTFDDFIKTQSSALVMFYAPWCPHCQKLKPAFGEVAKEVNTEKKIEGVMAAVDCTESSTVCSSNGVKGYPDLKYFKNGEFQFKYTGARSAKAFRDFMKDPKKPQAPPPPKDWSKDGSKVVFLTDETFNDFLSNHSDVLILFYAPWCGHCNAMKKNYYEAAKVLEEENPSVKLAAVDCTKQRKAASQVTISGYPTGQY